MGVEAVGLLRGPALVAAFLLVALMGVAIQRGSTCLVAAVDEILAGRTARRLRAILVAGLIAGTLTGLAMLEPRPGPAVPPIGFTLIGAVLLGVGAVVNRACVVGTVARIGSGEWAFLFTPLGIFAASFALAGLPLLPPAERLVQTSTAAGPVSAGLLLLILALALRARGAGPLSPRARPALRSPHLSTALIGLLFAGLTLLGSPWSYADALGHLARTGMADRPALQLALVGALLGSARLAGGLSGRRLRPRQTVRNCIRCLVGGALMATGAVLVPGSNDGLLLQAAPMLQLHALLALPVMAGTIAAVRMVRRIFPLKSP